jgi:hypothetical protein
MDERRDSIPMKTTRKFPLLSSFFFVLLLFWMFLGISQALGRNVQIPLMYTDPYLVSPRPMASMYVC